MRATSAILGRRDKGGFTTAPGVILETLSCFCCEAILLNSQRNFDLDTLNENATTGGKIWMKVGQLMATVLITGCDRGLGEEFALQYASKGDHVIATCLDPDQLAGRHKFGSNVDLVRLDVTDEAAVVRLADTLEGTKIDVLVNNAGISGPHPVLDETDMVLWRKMLEVNLIAPFVVSRAFAGHVASSEQKVIAFISSLMGSITLNNTGRSFAYRSSKAGLNMIMKSMAIDLGPRQICVIGLHPGKVVGTDEAGLLAKASVERMRGVIEECGPHQTGTFYNYNGQILPW
jgi:NAD(P)-dependent dehydrogenase (short-subunit alcohol dehydrogenase family)